MTEENLFIHYANKSEDNVDDWLELPHSHTYSEIFYMTEGTGAFIVSGTEFSVSKNDILLIAPGENHTEISSTASPLAYFVIGISGVSLTRTTLYTFPYFLTKDSEQELLFFFQQCHKEQTNQFFNSQTISKQLISTLLLLLERKQKLKIAATDKKDIEKVKQYLDNHYGDTIDLDSLAQKFHISKFYLSHQFKKEYEVSPIKYLNFLRINEAKKLLLSSNYSITEIAQQVGFTSPSYLTQSFKKEVGLSPSEFKTKNKRSGY